MVLLAQQAVHQLPKKLTWIELEPIPKRKSKEEPPSKRIVQTAEGQKTDKAAPDAFLGKQNQTVDRQTVSEKELTRMGQEASKPKARAKEKIGALGNLGVPILPPGQTLTEEDPTERLAPAWKQDTGVPQDYVKGLKKSERTALNTREYVFYGYYQRIRSRLELAWDGVLREHLHRMYRSGRRLASEMDHTTKILVTLNARGEIVRVQVVEASGTRDLDDAAVGAFNRAGPFPNPPKGMVDVNGQIQISWQMVLKT